MFIIFPCPCAVYIYKIMILLNIPVTIDMVKKVISQMKAGKAPDPSGIVVERIRAAGDMGASMIRDLAVAIFFDGKIPSDWKQSFIVCHYTGKGA